MLIKKWVQHRALNFGQIYMNDLCFTPVRFLEEFFQVFLWGFFFSLFFFFPLSKDRF